MNTETTEIGDIDPSWRPDEVFRLLRLALEPDAGGNTALDLEAWSGVPTDSVRVLPPTS